MGLESSPQYPDDINVAWPLESDTRREGAAHMRGIKNVLVNVTKNLSGAPMDTNILHQTLRIGAYQLVFPGDAYSPANFVGGTWVKAGCVAVDHTTVVPDGAANPIPGWILWLWQRTA